MFHVNHAIVSANGSVKTSSFRMMHSKYETIQTEKELDKFLRNKMKHKGVYTQWKRFGSWTLSQNDDTKTHIYMWSFLKGNEPHTHQYVLDNDQPQQVYDDMLLLQFREKDSANIPLKESLPWTKDNIADWLECVVQQSKKQVKKKKASLPKKKSSIPKQSTPAPKPPTLQKTKSTDNCEDDLMSMDDEETLLSDNDDEDEIVIETENADAIDTKDNDCSGTDSDDDENGVNNSFLIDDDDDDDDDENMSDVDDKLSDDDEDDDANHMLEAIYDDNVLMFEEYTYDTQCVNRPNNTLLSLWTK